MKSTPPARNHSSEKKIIGWTEKVHFPDWGIEDVKAKIDSGARTSALHVENIKTLNHGTISFDVVTGRRKPWKVKHVKAHIVKTARVRSSNGDYSERFFIKTRIRLGEIEKEIELSLVSRSEMLFRMLLGRKALESDFLVDVNRRNTCSKKKKKLSQRGEP